MAENFIGEGRERANGGAGRRRRRRARAGVIGRVSVLPSAQQLAGATDRQPLIDPCFEPAHRIDIPLGIHAVAARAALRREDVVATLPAAQGIGRHASESGYSFDIVDRRITVVRQDPTSWSAPSVVMGATCTMITGGSRFVKA